MILSSSTLLRFRRARNESSLSLSSIKLQLQLQPNYYKRQLQRKRISSWRWLSSPNQHQNQYQNYLQSVIRTFSVPTNANVSSTSTSTKVYTLDQQQDQEQEKFILDMNQQPPLDSRRLYKYLQLKSFSDWELKNTFQAIISTDTTTGTNHNQNDNNNSINNNNNKNSKMANSSMTQDHLAAYLVNVFQDIETKNGYANNNKYINSSNDGSHKDQEEHIASIREAYAKIEAQRCWTYFEKNNSSSKSKYNNKQTPTKSQQQQQQQHNGDEMTITQDEFVSMIQKSATSLDVQKIWPLTLSMLLVGSSVGVVTPAMPFVVQNLGLTAGEYGLVVSAFALAKMTGNIPSAVLVEHYGRKPYLVYTMALVAVGVGGIGLAGSFEQLYMCRLFTGLGVSCLSAAVTMTVTDLSTPLNRASTFAPIMSAFAAGTALGPALGGFLCDGIGINPTFYLVGASYIGLAAVNNMLLTETKPKPHIKLPWQTLHDSSNNSNSNSNSKQQASIRQSFEDALGQWIPLLSTAPIRNVCAINGFYWVALAGSQMTLLPLILTDPSGLAMTATDVGKVYMGMSLVQVMGNPVFAKIVDRVGKVPGIVSGCTMISTAMATLPLCTDLQQMACVLAIWAAGSSLLSTSPISYISDKVADEKRAQAIALLRTSGDVGFLIGASSMGALADWTGSLDMAMQSSSGILLTATGWFTVRNLMDLKIFQNENEKQKSE